MSNILYEVKNHIAVITFNRGEVLNALSSSFVKEISVAVARAEADEDVYVIVLTGSGKAFVAGADIEEMYPMNGQEIFEFSAYATNLNLKLEEMAKPVIAAINGYALGGGLELAMACDIRIASNRAKMGLTETKLGVICGSGGTQRLCRIVGEGMAKEMIFTGKVIDADEALRIRLVNHVTEPDKLMDTVMDMAEQIVSNGQIAVRTSKDCINYARESDIAEGCLYERHCFSEIFETEDQKIGMGAFIRKEKEVKFKNR